MSLNDTNPTESGHAEQPDRAFWLGEAPGGEVDLEKARATCTGNAEADALIAALCDEAERLRYLALAVVSYEASLTHMLREVKAGEAIGAAAIAEALRLGRALSTPETAIELALTDFVIELRDTPEDGPR